MAAVPAQLPDEFGPGPIDDSVLRFIKTHRARAVWEGKGQGACHFLQWEDTQEITTINDLVDESKHGISVDSTSTSHELVTKMGDLSINNLKRKFDSLEMENPQHLPTSVAVHEHFEKDQEPVIERSEHDETSENLTSTKYIDPSRVEDSSNLQDLVVLEVELSSIMKKSLLTTHLTLKAEIHCRQAEFWRQITAAGDTSTEVTDCISQVLGLHILGWLGRLAFPPPRCLLVLPPRPLSCGVFPNFDSIFFLEIKMCLIVKALQIASQEAEEATKLCHQREQKRNAAKAALEMARIKLRQ